MRSLCVEASLQPLGQVTVFPLLSLCNDLCSLVRARSLVVASRQPARELIVFHQLVGFPLLSPLQRPLLTCRGLSVTSEIARCVPSSRWVPFVVSSVTTSTLLFFLSSVWSLYLDLWSLPPLRNRYNI